MIWNGTHIGFDDDMTLNETIKNRFDALLKEKRIDEDDVIRKLQDDGMTYKAAHAMVWRIKKAQVSSLHKATREKLEKALDIPDANILTEEEEKQMSQNAAREAVVIGIIEAPKASEADIIRDIKSLLSDPATAPYIRMATKILKNIG